MTEGNEINVFGRCPNMIITKCKGMKWRKENEK